MKNISCKMVKQGYSMGSCLTEYKQGKEPACKVTLKWEEGIPLRLIQTAQLSRPEHYFSIYQSGCNLSCKKCHSWEFVKYARGEWCSPGDLANLAISYAKTVTFKEPRERATSYHALEVCRCCGSCVELRYEDELGEKPYLISTGRRSKQCPGVLQPEQVVLSPQGFGPARNIIAFTGGDLACQPEFYALTAEKIKNLQEDLWVLFETNGYGLTPLNLDLFRLAGIDSFWLDIKAYDKEVHYRLTGVSNEWILRLPEEILKRGFVLEVLSLYIPGWVEIDQLEKIAFLLANINKDIPFTILAFFPQYKMMDVSPPALEQMLLAYHAVKACGLKNVRLGNIGVFVKTQEEYHKLVKNAPEAI